VAGVRVVATHDTSRLYDAACFLSVPGTLLACLPTCMTACLPSYLAGPLALVDFTFLLLVRAPGPFRCFNLWQDAAEVRKRGETRTRSLTFGRLLYFF
jgi:hypothetical protein